MVLLGCACGELCLIRSSVSIRRGHAVKISDAYRKESDCIGSAMNSINLSLDTYPVTD